MKKKFLKFAYVACAAIIGGFMFTSCGDDDDNGGNPNPPKTDPSDIASSNLIAYFPFEGNGNDVKGTLPTPTEKNATYPEGRRGKAYQGGGTESDQAYLKYALTESNKLAKLTGTTFAFWAKIAWTGNGGKEPMIFQIDGSIDVPWGNFSLKQNRTTTNDSVDFFNVFVKETAEWSSQKIANYGSNRFTYGTWMHIAVTYDNISSRFYMYVNGKVVDLGDGFSKRWTDPSETTPLGDLKFAGVKTFVIGAWADNVNKVETWAPTDSYKGLLDEFRIYDRALTAAEVQQLYDAEFENINE